MLCHHLSITQNVVLIFFTDVPVALGVAPTPSFERPAEPCHADWEEVTPRRFGRSANRCLLLHVAMEIVKSAKCCCWQLLPEVEHEIGAASF
jgi:hypothetical protein